MHEGINYEHKEDAKNTEPRTKKQWTESLNKISLGTGEWYVEGVYTEGYGKMGLLSLNFEWYISKFPLRKYLDIFIYLWVTHNFEIWNLKFQVMLKFGDFNPKWTNEVHSEYL